jgi:hypothetical protein
MQKISKNSWRQKEEEERNVVMRRQARMTEVLKTQIRIQETPPKLFQYPFEWNSTTLTMNLGIGASLMNPTSFFPWGKRQTIQRQ